MKYAALFQSLSVGGTEIKNRFVMPPMGSSTSDENNLFTEQSFAYYQERARGGFGLIFTGYLCVSEEGLSYPKQAQIYNDACLPGLTEVANKIHRSGAKCFAQLQHAGSAACVENKVSASAVPFAYSDQAVQALTTGDIKRLVERFVQAALRAKQAGFDGVELHGAHGYLIHQFLSKLTNKRSDAYGGGAAGRATFACELIAAIRSAVGADYPISIRFNACDDMEGGNTVEDACAQAVLFEKAGADLLSVSRGTLSSGTIIAPFYHEEGWNVENTRRIKSCVRIPVIAVGRVNDPALAESIVKSGAADLVALGRQSICDPHFPEKVASGHEDEIFYCTGCLQRCQGEHCEAEDTGVSCLINPLSGKEDRWKIMPAEQKKNVAIVGAGVAGLEAAWILAARGHHVTVLEKRDDVGGQMRLAAVPPMKYMFGRIPITYMALGRKYGVEYRLGAEANRETLRQLKPDIVLLSTGASPAKSRIPGIEQPHIVQANDVLAGQKNLIAKNVLIIGAGLVGCETAEYLLQYGSRVTIVDMVKEMAAQMGWSTRKLLLKKLAENHVAFYPEACVTRFTENGILYTKEGEQRELTGFDQIVLAMGSSPNTALLKDARAVADRVYPLGDASKAVDAKAAIYAAAKLALTL